MVRELSDGDIVADVVDTLRNNELPPAKLIEELKRDKRYARAFAAFMLVESMEEKPKPENFEDAFEFVGEVPEEFKKSSLKHYVNLSRSYLDELKENPLYGNEKLERIYEEIVKHI